MSVSSFEELLDYRRSVAELYGRLRRTSSSEIERCHRFRVCIAKGSEKSIGAYPIFLTGPP